MMYPGGGGSNYSHIHYYYLILAYLRLHLNLHIHSTCCYTMSASPAMNNQPTYIWICIFTTPGIAIAAGFTRMDKFSLKKTGIRSPG